MTTYHVKKYADEFDVFGQRVPEIKTPIHKVKDWFYAKEVSKDVPSSKWTYILAVVKESEKAQQIIVKGCTYDGDDAGILLWCPKSCIEPIPSDVPKNNVAEVEVDGCTFYIRYDKENRLAAFTEDGAEHCLIDPDFSYTAQIVDYLEC